METNKYGYACGAVETRLIAETIQEIAKNYPAIRSIIWVFDGIYVDSVVRAEDALMEEPLLALGIIDDLRVEGDEIVAAHGGAA